MVIKWTTNTTSNYIIKQVNYTLIANHYRYHTSTSKH